MKTYRGKVTNEAHQDEDWYADLGAMRFPGVEGQPIINMVKTFLLKYNFYQKYLFLDI